MSQTAQLRIDIEQVALLSVTGHLDEVGLRELQRDVDRLLDGGARFLATDLAQVTDCDHQLLDLLARTSDLLEHRGGWLRLVGLAAAVLDILHEAALPEVLRVYRASDWALARTAGPRRLSITRAHWGLGGCPGRGGRVGRGG